ncbi:MAG: hypothetical protein MUF81_02060 [Verrucomicrobia bacterium]|jgi:hypothetical protein|nr:hypothetical protein [Verrucomicrobiota bacterium]
MNTKLKSLRNELTVALALVPAVCGADTLVQGDVSGAWTKANSPYRMIDNCTVSAANTLTIQPGVTVKIDAGYSLNVYGQIIAAGLPADRIIFKSRWPSNYWNQIFIQHGGGADSRFAYCDFSDATNAIYLASSRLYAPMTPEFANCLFSNCLSYCIYGYTHGVDPGTPPSPLNVKVTNSRFQNSANGIGIYALVSGAPNPTIANNIFDTISGTSLRFQVGDYMAGCVPQVFNNLFKQCEAAISTADPYDCQMNNNIFQQCGVAVKESGALSRNVGYNCFFNNQTNFIGYPVAYGTFDDQNRNGTTADAFMNIASDPLFVATNDFHLTANSPCIDAGAPDWALTDMCITNGVSQGNSYPDLGPYGGPHACNWLDDVPKLPVTAFMTQSNGVVALNWGAIPRSTYQVHYLTNFVFTGTNKWTNFPNGLVVAADKPTSVNVPITEGVTQQFFRVQSLGRTPGN